MRSRLWLAGGVTLMAGALWVLQAPPGNAQARGQAVECAALAEQDFGAGVRITGAQIVPPAAAGTVRASPEAPPIAVAVPSWCRVSGTINARTGAGGKPFAIGFQLALPQQWNGRFLFQGGGGLNGSIRPPLGLAGAGAVPALARGFAVVSTDSGHEGAVFDAAFMADQRATLDFAQDSVASVTTLARRIVETRYGRAPHHSYIAGCSTGGREGMLAMQRYPEMFDGVVIGAPAMRPGWANLGTSHAAVAFNQAAPRDAQGTPIPAQAFSTADRATFLSGLLAQCDGLDGLNDGVIENVGACDFQPAKLVCKPGQTANCLTAAQARALADGYRSPRDAAGNDLYIRFPHDRGNVETGPGIPGFLPTGLPGPLGPPKLALQLDADAVARTIRADAGQMLTDTNVWTNLSTFLGRGGKILFYHGVSDPWFSAWDTWDYFQRAEKANGVAAWAQASRFYMVPGMGHCSGGANTFDSFDMLGAVVDWVEKGVAPAAITATRSRPSAATRPLCPFPAYARYTGNGDESRAENFTCAL